jgi:hypothetical protein
MVPYCRHSNVATKGELRHLVGEFVIVAVSDGIVT